MPALRVAVVGAGWAGLACAVRLAQAGARVTLLERAPAAGGRARRVHWRTGGQDITLDNGQHIMIGAYSACLGLMRDLGVSEQNTLARIALTLTYPDGPSMVAPRLPAPLHLAAAMVRARGFGVSDRLAMLRLVAAARAGGWRVTPDRTVLTWLHQHGQTPRVIDLLWAPLCVAALNTPSESASAQVFATVLRDSVGAARASSDMLVPTTDLSALIPDAAVRMLREQGADVRFGHPLTGLRPTDSGWQLDAAGLGGEHFDHVVLAAHWHDTHGLLGTLPGASADAAFAGFKPSRIATVWLLAPDPQPGNVQGRGSGFWERHRITALRSIDAASDPGQWLFARQRVGPDRRLLGVVISAASPDLEPADLVARVIAQINRALRLPSGHALATETPARVIVEKGATFACTPSLRRPSMRTARPGLWLAGDYVGGEPRGDYPGTLESAVRSGERAAGAIVESALQGRAQR